MLRKKIVAVFNVLISLLLIFSSPINQDIVALNHQDAYSVTINVGPHDFQRLTPYSKEFVLWNHVWFDLEKTNYTTLKTAINLVSISHPTGFMIGYSLISLKSEELIGTKFITRITIDTPHYYLNNSKIIVYSELRNIAPFLFFAVNTTRFNFFVFQVSIFFKGIFPVWNQSATAQVKTELVISESSGPEVLVIDESSAHLISPEDIMDLYSPFTTTTITKERTVLVRNPDYNENNDEDAFLGEERLLLYVTTLILSLLVMNRRVRKR